MLFGGVGVVEGGGGGGGEGGWLVLGGGGGARCGVEGIRLGYMELVWGRIFSRAIPY